VPRRLGFLFVVIVLLAGCGSAEVAAEKHANTKAAALEPKKNRNTFRAEAKAACAGLHRRLVRLEKGKASPDHVLVEVADAWDASLRKLRRLDPPLRDRRRFRQMLVYFGRAVRAIRAVPTAEGEMVLAPIAAMLDQGGKGATIAQSLGLLTCSAAPPAPTKHELERWRKHMERAARKQFAQLPRLDQPAHPGRVRPRVEAAPGS
jgi:hypothetical protein